jgi:hypothetical protein
LFWDLRVAASSGCKNEEIDMSAENLVSPNLTYTLPLPNLVMPQGPQEVILAVFGGGAVLLVLYAIYQAYSRRSWLPVLFLVAGGFSVLLEPMADVLGNVIHSPVGQINAFQAEGHPVPWHIVLGYVWYYGLLNIILFDRFIARSMTPALWWKTAFWSALAVTAVEQVPIYYGLWVYYGVHPFKLGIMPISMAAPNAASVIIPSLLIYRLMPILKGWRQLLVLSIIPCTVVGTHAGASVPSYTALGQDTANMPMWILEVATLITTAWSLMLIWLGINIIHNRFPEAEAYSVNENVKPAINKPIPSQTTHA